MTRARDARRREDRNALAAAANQTRTEASQGRAEHTASRGPIVPHGRFVFVGLLDALAIAAGNGELPEGVRRVAVELAQAILNEGTLNKGTPTD